MFETKEEIRRAARAKFYEQERRKGRQDGIWDSIQEIRRAGRSEGRQESRRAFAEILRRHAVRDAATGRVTLELTPEVIAAFIEIP